LFSSKFTGGTGRQTCGHVGVCNPDGTLTCFLHSSFFQPFKQGKTIQSKPLKWLKPVVVGFCLTPQLKLDVDLRDFGSTIGASVQLWEHRFNYGSFGSIIAILV
jgi:hypothetical protein